MGAHGAALIVPGATILTHCNAGALATAGYGTALGRGPRRARGGQAGVGGGVRDAPLPPGRALTAWELKRDRIR